MKALTFLKAINSPFKPFKLKWYMGKVAIGTPYFYPRKWIEATPKLAKKATLEYIKKEEEYNKRNPESTRKIKSYEEIYNERLRYSYAIPKKIGFDFIGLGWKTKWKDIDYRFESAPIWSFVFFKWQIAITFIAPEQDHYWTAWLYYERNTDKTKSKAERIEQCKKEYPMVWSVYTKEGTEKVDYYTKILK